MKSSSNEMAAASSVGVPVKLLKEAESHVITVELKNGELYRGKLEAAEDTMNVQLSAVIHTARDGKVTKCVGAAVLRPPISADDC